MDTNKQLLELLLPEGIFEWFNVTSSTSDEHNVLITLTEKDEPPLANPRQKIIARKFHDITITDFPVRGKRCLLTFRRRYWKIEGQEAYLKRNIDLSFPGTKLASEFATFLKEDGGHKSGFPEYYSRIPTDPSQRV